MTDFLSRLAERALNPTAALRPSLVTTLAMTYMPGEALHGLAADDKPLARSEPQPAVNRPQGRSDVAPQGAPPTLVPPAKPGLPSAAPDVTPPAPEERSNSPVDQQTVPSPPAADQDDTAAASPTSPPLRRRRSRRGEKRSERRSLRLEPLVGRTTDRDGTASPPPQRPSGIPADQSGPGPDSDSRQLVAQDIPRLKSVDTPEPQPPELVPAPRRPSTSEQVGPLPDRRAAPPEAASSPPTIQVTIGRIDVRAITSPPPSAPSAKPRPGPRLTLEEYLRQRNGDKR